MTGPPFSSAIVAVGNAVGLVHLDRMPPTSPIPETNLSQIGLRSASVVRTSTTTTLQFGAHQVGDHPVRRVNHFVYAWGTDSGEPPDWHYDLGYHTPGRRGVLSNVDLETGAFDQDQATRIPYYELHGGILAFIWSITTLLGGVIARYFRSWPGWIDAHQLLQSVATVLSFPLTLLSFVAKEGRSTHYSSVHGVFGLCFSLAATVQGVLGTYAHTMFVHEYGCVSKNEVRMARVRMLHRRLGKLLLVCAVGQIALGLLKYDPKTFVRLRAVREVDTATDGIAWWYVTYTSVAWAAVVALEIRYRILWGKLQQTLGQNVDNSGGGGREQKGDDGVRHGRKRLSTMATARAIDQLFEIRTGAGYVTAEDLRVNREAYENAVTLVDALLNQTEGTLTSWDTIQEWANAGGGDVNAVARCLRVPMRFVYWFAHRSMKTSEILDYARFLDDKVSHVLAKRDNSDQFDTGRHRILNEASSSRVALANLLSNNSRANKIRSNGTDGVAAQNTMAAVGLEMAMWGGSDVGSSSSDGSDGGGEGDKDVLVL